MHLQRQKIADEFNPKEISLSQRVLELQNVRWNEMKVGAPENSSVNVLSCNTSNNRT